MRFRNNRFFPALKEKLRELIRRFSRLPEESELSDEPIDFSAPSVPYYVNLAEKFNLDYKESYDINEALAALREGGRVIALVGGIEPGNRGIFTAGGHFIVLIAVDGKDEICILDPNWTSKTFPKWEKEGLVRTEGTLVYTSPEVLHQEVKKLGDPSYSIFSRKRG